MAETLRFIETHCHFDEPDFDVDRTALTQQMQTLGVTDLVFPAVKAAAWGRLQAVCARWYQDGFG